MSYPVLFNNRSNTHLTHGTKDLEPLTIKGDIYGFSTIPARIPAGTNGQLLRYNSANANGVDAIGNISPTTTNTILGQQAGAPTGGFNTAFGNQAMNGASSAASNTSIGAFTLLSGGNGGSNTALGHSALQNCTSGSTNTALGRNALQNFLTGTNNIGVGNNAGTAYTGAESTNIVIGNTGVVGESSVIRIGTAQTKAFVAGINGITTGGAAVAVLIDGSGQLGTISSSERYKQNIEEMTISKKLYDLRPVEFDYKSNGEHSYGLIAEEVDKVMPEIVIKNQEGECETVQYHLLVPMLLNELIHQHQHIMYLEGMILDLNNMGQKLIEIAEKIN